MDYKKLSKVSDSVKRVADSASFSREELVEWLDKAKPIVSEGHAAEIYPGNMTMQVVHWQDDENTPEYTLVRWWGEEKDGADEYGNVDVKDERDYDSSVLADKILAKLNAGTSEVVDDFSEDSVAVSEFKEKFTEMYREAGSVFESLELSEELTEDEKTEVWKWANSMVEGDGYRVNIIDEDFDEGENPSYFVELVDLEES